MAPLNPLGNEARELNRFFYGGTTQLELDSAGRISLSPEQLAHAGISKAVKVVGAGRVPGAVGRGRLERAQRRPHRPGG